MLRAALVIEFLNGFYRHFPANFLKKFHSCGGVSDGTARIREFSSKIGDRGGRRRFRRLDRAATSGERREGHAA